MSFGKDAPFACCWLLLALLGAVCGADVLVQLNVNRPLTDVSEKFVSFAVRPDDLYRALDGPNRKALTRMASLLGDSYVRFVGDYFFASTAENKLRNPTKIIWKGFNRWTRAVNWTMIIPVPYEPGSWDPLVTLKILNSSYQLGISDCIWQLGTDFGTSAARDYVAELKTLHLMVDSFKPYVDDWAMMGADISAGSSAEETRRYVDMSRDLNAAYGWAQPADLQQANSIANYVNPSDASLRVLLGKKVPVWLSLPPAANSKKTKQSLALDETSEGLRWAQALGEAATSGFNAIFKRLTIEELEQPGFSMYVTALFKRVMGSRVFSARPLHIFGGSNKLYTHCANSVSGGIAFMLVNADAAPRDIVLRSLTKMSTSEVWQYSLTQRKGVVYLNDEKLSVNSTLRPQKKAKSPDKALQLSAPGAAVTFWVLPNVNLEHCQFTEIEAAEVEAASGEQTPDKEALTSSDRLVRQLIQESALPHSVLAKLINRRRRYATLAPSRQRRFVLEDRNAQHKGFGRLFDPLLGAGVAEKQLKKRDSTDERSGQGALDWLNSLLSGSLPAKQSLLKRRVRSAENIFGSLFGNDDGRPTAITRKITEIRKPERKSKPLFNAEEFDEEAFFKKAGETEPEYTRLPEGDVHLKHIATPDGEEIEDGAPSETLRKSRKSLPELSQEEPADTKELRLLPTEFYEAFPGISPFKSATLPPSKPNIGSALNSLLFAEPFSKKTGGKSSGATKGKSAKQKDVDPLLDVEEVSNGQFEHGGSTGGLAKDFVRAQQALSKSMFGDEAEEPKEPTTTEAAAPQTTATPEEKEEEESRQEAKLRLLDLLTENLEQYFHERESRTKKQQPEQKTITKKELKLPWWDFGTLPKRRKTRALQMQVPDEAWQHNVITKDEEFMPLGAVMPEDIRIYEYERLAAAEGPKASENSEQPQRQANTVSSPAGQAPPQPEGGAPQTTYKFVATVKKKVTNLVEIVARHVQGWYNTLAKHVDVVNVSGTSSGVAPPTANAPK